MSNTPRICPVTGMFLDEPKEGDKYWHTGYYHPCQVTYYKEETEEFICTASWQLGNCFATREDAERYAKHLKAMAKLRRLGGFDGKTTIGMTEDYISYLQHIHTAIYNQLTPEEQNALLWPSEVK